MDIVNEILNKHEQFRIEASQSIQVTKLIEPDVYPKDLLVIDTNELNVPELRGPNKEEVLKSSTRDCIQILLNKLADYPKETKDGKIFIKVVGAAYNLPREKPVPVPKPLTKWERFAKEKGIQKKKKSRTTWDDTLQKWVPTYGYRKVQAEKQKDWLIEVPQNVDPNTDMFAEKAKTKKENVAKNEYQRLRNIAAARKIKVPQVGLPPMEANLHVPQLQIAADVARVSTASLGKFQPTLPEDKNTKQTKNVGNSKKRRLMNSNEEKSMNLDIAEKVLKKKPKLNLSKAVNMQIHEEQSQRSIERAEKRKGKKKSFGDSDKPKKSKGQFKRPKALKGKRAGKKSGGGRKRR